MVHKSLDVAHPGDVIVVAAGESRSSAVLGDIIATKARHRDIGGFVADGLIRDLPSIRVLDFPMYARGTTPIGPLHRGPGEVNYAVACGDVVVNAGDIVVADAEGVVVVPRQIAVELLTPAAPPFGGPGRLPRGGAAWGVRQLLGGLPPPAARLPRRVRRRAGGLVARRRVLRARRGRGVGC